MTLSAGIDIGSRTVKLVVVDSYADNNIVTERVCQNTHDPISVCREILQNATYDRLTATGYGRHLFARYINCNVITEIKAVARGASHLFPDCRTILDIGGQDTKAVSLDNLGKMHKFEMNDKCAAGTGKFLEIMATALGYTMDDFIQNAITAPEAIKVSAMCTVFAESEIIGMVAKEKPRDQLALGIHLAAANRAVSMLKRIAIRDEIVFCGGAAKNLCLLNIIKKNLGREIQVAHNPQTVAALGCALT